LWRDLLRGAFRGRFRQTVRHSERPFASVGFGVGSIRPNPFRKDVTSNYFLALRFRAFFFAAFFLGAFFFAAFFFVAFFFAAFFFAMANPFKTKTPSELCRL